MQLTYSRFEQQEWLCLHIQPAASRKRSPSNGLSFFLLRFDNLPKLREGQSYSSKENWVSLLCYCPFILHERGKRAKDLIEHLEFKLQEFLWFLVLFTCESTCRLSLFLMFERVLKMTKAFLLRPRFSLMFQYFQLLVRIWFFFWHPNVARNGIVQYKQLIWGKRKALLIPLTAKSNNFRAYILLN